MPLGFVCASGAIRAPLFAHVSGIARLRPATSAVAPPAS